MNERVTPELQDLHAYVDGQLAPEPRQRVDHQANVQHSAHAGFP